MSTRAAANPKAARRGAKLQHEEPRRSVRLTARAALLLVMVMVVATFAVAPMRAYLAERGRLNELHKQTQLLEKANQDLSNEIAQLKDPAYLEHLARACLGMVRPGETSFIAVPRNGAPQIPDC